MSFNQPKIDVHAHFIPPAYIDALHGTGYGNPEGMPFIPPWSEEIHVKMMQDLNISKSIVSLAPPGSHFLEGDDAVGRRVARETNEFAERLKQRRPEQFGYWASLPLPDIEGTLAEISHVFDKLHPDGVFMLTNHHGIYLGDARYEPVFEELNRRGATVFIHPATPCIHSIGKALPLPHLPVPMFEFFFDTARAVINLFVTGSVRRYSNITFVIPQLGGALPPLINRFAGIASILKLPNMDAELSNAWIRERLNKQFFFDTAGWSVPEQLKGLLQYVGIERILFGSDWPWTPIPAIAVSVRDHEQHLPEFLSEEEQEALYRTNALKLLGYKKSTS